jgi:hypothetical protein
VHERRRRFRKNETIWTFKHHIIEFEASSSEAMADISHCNLFHFSVRPADPPYALRGIFIVVHILRR